LFDPGGQHSLPGDRRLPVETIGGVTVEIKIIYDNRSVKKGVKTAWGFAALVTMGQRKFLFDTGGRADILLVNMKALKIKPAGVTDIFISHNHWDHAGGLFGFLTKKSKVKVYLPISFSSTYHREVRAAGGEPIRIGPFSKIAKDLYSTGSLGEGLIEQALIVDLPQGLIVITGCAHPGILNIVRSAKSALKKPVLAVIGGFHLASQSPAGIKKIIADFKRLGVAYVAPSHCTGERAIAEFQKGYRDKFMPIGVGSVLKPLTF
jgi:7,8-dihydropterin-6-yl-methyl-4-(beta-D-ribofuranosyl)aminobenzene 5'-phosphate synthase